MKKIFIVLSAMLASITVFSQEFTKSLGIKTDTSIVREVTYQTWLTYVYHQSVQSLFALATETGATAPILYLPDEYYVSDFEIYDDTVFFCGHTTSTPQVAIFGYFDLLSFPASTVRCCHVAGMKSMDKMTVFNNNNNPHFVYTGVLEYNHQSIVGDALRNSSNSWDYYMSYCINLTELGELVYDDVAVTDNYIIATSRTPSLDSGYINIFNKPQSYSTMFPYHFMYKKIGYNTTSPILITACDGNYYATLCENGSSYFVMSRYFNLNNDVSLRSQIDDLSVRGVNFNKDSRNVEVLVKAGGLKYGASLAIHYEPTLYGSSMVPLHQYSNENIYSFDYLTNHTDCFIATGEVFFDINYSDLLRLYRYKYDEWHDCTKEDNLKADKIDNYLSDFDYDYVPMTTQVDAVLIESSDYEAEIETICEY